MGRLALAIILLVSVVFGWHLYCAADARRQAEDLRGKHSIASTDHPVTVNPVTDVVRVPIGGLSEKGKSDNPLEALGDALGSMIGALAKAIEPSFERDLNLRAREHYDIYAMLLPYRAEVVTEKKTKASEDEKE